MANPVQIVTGASEIAVSATNPLPVTLTTGTTDQDVNLVAVLGVAPDVNNGAVSAGSLRVTIANDSTGQIIALGNVASAVADAGNPVKVGAKYVSAVSNFTDGNRTNLISTQKGSLRTFSTGIALVGADTVSNAVIMTGRDDDNTGQASPLATVGYTFNNTNFDRIRSVINATNSTGTGIQASGILAQVDDTSPTAVSENQFGNIRMSAQRALLTNDISTYPYSPVLGTAATPLIAGSGNVANASAAATLTGTATTTVFLTGFEAMPGGSTAAAIATVTVAGLLGGSRIYNVGSPAGATVMGSPLIVQFSPPLPASAVNTAISVTMAALGAGNLNAAVVAHGFYA